MHTHRDTESHRRGNMTLECCSPESSSYLGKQLLARLSVQGNYQHGSVCAPLLGQVLHFYAAADGAGLGKLAIVPTDGRNDAQPVNGHFLCRLQHSREKK